MRIVTFMAIGVAVVAAIAVSARVEALEARAQAMASISGCTNPSVRGRALLYEEKTDAGIKTVKLLLMMRGVPPGRHGVHIHETGSCTPCGDAGGHYDPGPNTNTSPDGNHPFHMGDLENILVGRNGRGRLWVDTTRVTLSDGPLSIFDDDGSSIIVHVDEDTFCPNGEVAGCAGGGRLACGIIERGPPF